MKIIIKYIHKSYYAVIGVIIIMFYLTSCSQPRTFIAYKSDYLKQNKLLNDFNKAKTFDNISNNIENAENTNTLNSKLEDNDININDNQNLTENNQENTELATANNSTEVENSQPISTEDATNPQNINKDTIIITTATEANSNEIINNKTINNTIPKNLTATIKESANDVNRLNNKPNLVAKGKILVQSGDSVYKIAKLYGVSVRDLIEINKLKQPYILYPGDWLKLSTNSTHIVMPKENVVVIARQYDISLNELIIINKLEKPYIIYPGQKLILPFNIQKTTKSITKAQQKTNIQNAQKIAENVTTNLPNNTKAESKIALSNQSQLTTNQNKIVKTIKKKEIKSFLASKNFIWPVRNGRNKVISAYGNKKNDLQNNGINIAKPLNSEVTAVANGVIVYIGNELRGYGNLVIIKHHKFWISAYAHLNNIYITKGSIVNQGQRIGTVGKTGNVSQPQLHFSLRNGKYPVNPTKYLR